MYGDKKGNMPTSIENKVGKNKYKLAATSAKTYQLEDDSFNGIEVNFTWERPADYSSKGVQVSHAEYKDSDGNYHQHGTIQSKKVTKSTIKLKFEAAWGANCWMAPEALWCDVQTYDLTTLKKLDKPKYVQWGTGHGAECTFGIQLRKVETPETYTITYNGNGADGGATAAGTKTEGKDYTISANGFTKTGHYFTGWADDSKEIYSPGEIYDEDDNLTLYAQWAPNIYKMTMRHFTWNVSTNTWNADPWAITTDIAAYGNVFTPYYTTAPTGFQNWSLGDRNCWVNGWTVTGDGTFDIYYYPHTYTQTVRHYKGHADSGSWTNFETETVDRLYGQTFTPTYSKTPIGYHNYTMSTGAYTVTGANTVSVYYDANAYTVVYNPNNPNNNAQVAGTMNNSIFRYDRGAYLTPNTFTRNAWSFVNWNTHPNGYGTARDNGAYVFNWTSNNGDVINLYAQWSLNKRNVDGRVHWEDQNNRYSSRPANVTVTLHNNGDSVSMLKGPDANPITVAGESNYSFTNTQTQRESDNQNYNYWVTQNVIPGYKTTINGFNITNTLITPTYTSNITYTPIDTFENRLLKNGKVKLTATATTTPGSDARAGLHNGVATFTIDSGVTLDTSKIKVSFYDASTGTTKTITNYSVSNNIITVNFGEDSKGISEKGDKITIEVEGTLNKIGNYTSNLVVTGKLRDVSINSGLTEAQKNTGINLGIVTQASSNANGQNGKLTVEYQMPKANIKITKHDSITEKNLTDATFTLYEWNGTEYIEKETITDTNGDGIYESKYYEWNTTTDGKYKIVETGVPANHKNLNFSMEFRIDQLQKNNYTITPDYSNTSGISDACPGHKASKYTIKYGVRNPDDFDSTNGIVENEPYKVKARIDLLDSQTLKQIQNEATFKIYEWDNSSNSYKPYTSYTTGQEVKMTRLQDKTYLTGEWLYYTTTNEGKYRIVEETAPTGYYGDYIDDEAKQKRTYDINILDLVGANGQNDEMTITLTNDNGYFTNIRTKAEIKLNKIDKETRSFAQADATLEGAIYEVFAKNKIYHADGITANYTEEKALLYKPDDLVTTKQTDSEGKITFDDLECGTYYIKEKTASEGYLLDGNTYEVNVEYRGQNIKIVKEERTSEEKVKKQAFQMYKVKETDRTEYEGLQNAGFTIYLISNLSIVKDGKISKNEDGTYTLNDEQAKRDTSITNLANKNGTYNIADLVDYYYKIKYTEGNMDEIPQDENSYFLYNNMHEEKVKDYSTSSEGIYIQELKSDIDGYIRSPELAYGEYIVLETTTPKDLEVAVPFFIKIQNDLRTPQKLKFIQDGNFTTKIKLYKKDIDTGRAILQAGTKYLIRNEAGDLVTIKTWDMTNGYVEYGTLEYPFVTGKDGYLITPMDLEVGTYTVEELNAPNGYVLNGYEGYSKNGQTVKNPSAQLKFKVATNGVYYTDDYLDTNVIVVDQYNKAQVGTMTISTTGEFVKEATKDKNGNYYFTYETRPIEGVTYQIKAKEAIISQDGRNSIIYQKDKVVKTITSNSEGIAYAENLPQGKYYIVQTVAGNGFTLNEEIKEFEIKYGTNNEKLEVGTDEWKKEAERTPVVYLEESYQNQRQELKITINKIDGETNEGIKGTVIGLYAKENIQNIKTNNPIVEQDTLLRTNETNEQGQIVIEGNLPLNNYYVKEIKASVGYVKNNVPNNIDGTYDRSQIAVQEINTTLTNYKTNINIQKTDTEETVLPGATLELRDSKGNVVENWKTTEELKNIRGLKTNEQYSVVEVQPAEGYVTAPQINFIITEEGIVETESKHDDNTIIMEDEATKLRVELLDKETKEFVKGAVLKIVKVVDGQEVEVAKWTTEEAYYIEKLPIGHYKLIEEKAPVDQGYVQVEEIEFDIHDTKEVQIIQMLQERTKLQVNVIDKDTKEQIPGATFQIIRKVEETDEQGNKTTKEEVVREFETTEEPYYTEKLPIGTYTLREINSPTDKGYVTIEDKEFEIVETKEIQNVVVEHDVTKLQVNLVDEGNDNKQIPGATLQIINKETGEVVREFETAEEPYITEKLPTGHYILKQINPVLEEGQVTTEEVEFEVVDTRETQVVTMIQKYTKLEVELIDSETKEKVQGVNLQIVRITKETDEQGNEQTKEEVVREFTTGEENYTTERLPIGNYILREPKDQKDALVEKGYATLEDIAFEIVDTPDVQKVTLEQDHTKLEVELLDKETKEKVKDVNLQIVRVTEAGEEVVREFTTGEENYKTERLPIGNYILREPSDQKDALLNKGYATLEDIAFEIKDTKEWQKITAEQDYTKLEVELLDAENSEKVQGVNLQILKVTEAGEEVVKEFTTGEENYTTNRLPVGNYILREPSDQKDALLNKGYVTIEDTAFEIKDTAEVQKVTLKQDYTKLEVELLDKETKEKVQGVNLQIVKVTEDGEEVVREFTTGEENYTTIKLPVGNYILREPKDQKEALQEKGYASIEDIAFEIKDTKDVQKVTLEQDHTKLEVELLDKVTKEKIQGVNLQIVRVTEAGEEVVREFTTVEENYTTERLAVGNYILREPKDQKDALLEKGYVTIEDIAFEIKDLSEVQKVTLEQNHTKLEVELLDKETSEKVQGVKLQIVRVTESRRRSSKRIYYW